MDRSTYLALLGEALGPRTQCRCAAARWSASSSPRCKQLGCSACTPPIDALDDRCAEAGSPIATTATGRPLPAEHVGYPVAQVEGQLYGVEIACPTGASRPSCDIHRPEFVAAKQSLAVVPCHRLRTRATLATTPPDQPASADTRRGGHGALRHPARAGREHRVSALTVRSSSQSSP